MKNGQQAVVKHKHTPCKPELKSTSPSRVVSTDFQHVLASPQAASPGDVLRLQEAAGNGAVTGWLQSRTVQREPATDSSGTLNGQISSAIQNARGKGEGLPSHVQRDMESRLQADFSGVRLHTGPQADDLSRQISARAFTIGSDIFFRQGAYAPGTTRGQRTLRHELTHVIQQNGSAPSGSLKLGAPDTVQEQQAARAAQSTGAGGASGPASGGAVQRVIDYKSIALAFGGHITEAMVQEWTRDANTQKEAIITAILLSGQSIDEASREMLKLYGVDVDKMLEDLKNTGSQTKEDDGFPPMPTRPVPSIKNQLSKPLPPIPPQRNANSLQGQRNKPLPALPPLPEADVRARVLKLAQDENMPSGALLDALKDVGKGDLSRVSADDIKEVIALFKARNFNALTQKGVSVEHIVAFTGGYERLGVGDTKDQDQGLLGTIKDKTLGSKWGEGKVAGTADFLQNSVLLSALSGLGAGVGNLSMLNMLRPEGSEWIGKDAEAGTGLAGSIMMNTVMAAQATGALMQSGVHFSNMYKASGYHYSQRGLGMRQQGAEAGLSMFQGVSGLTQAGLGFGLGAKTFEARDSGVSNPASELGVASNAIGAATSGVSLGARGIKAGLAAKRGSSIMNMRYRPSSGLSEDGRKKEQALFPKLKAALHDAQSKKAKGQGLDMGKDATQVLGSTMKSIGFGVGGTAGSVLKGVGAATNLVGSLASPLIGKVKDIFRGKKVEKSGYRNMNEYRNDRVRSLETQDENGKKTQVSVRIGELASEANAVYDDLEKNCPPFKLGVEKTVLSTTRLLDETGETGLVSAVLTTTDTTERRAAIRNVLLSRSATF